METNNRLGLRTHSAMGPATLAETAADGYTLGMEKNKMKMTKVLLTGLLAALLLTPTAAQAKSHKKASKAKPSVNAAEAKALVKAGLSQLEDKNYDAAISNFSKATKEGSDSAAYFLLGYAHYQRGFRAGAPETADKEDAMQTINAYAMAVTSIPSSRASPSPTASTTPWPSPTKPSSLSTKPSNPIRWPSRPPPKTRSCRSTPPACATGWETPPSPPPTWP